MIDQRDIPAILSEIFAQTPPLWESVRVDIVFIIVISCGRILRSLNAPQRRRVHVTLPESISPIRPDKSAHPSSIHRTRYKPREKATATRFSWIIKRTKCRRARGSLRWSTYRFPERKRNVFSFSWKICWPRALVFLLVVRTFSFSPLCKQKQFFSSVTFAT